LTGCIYLNCCACYSRATNAGDKGFCLARTANANGATLASNTFVANVNIAIASVKIATGLVAQGDVAVARKIVFERARTDGCVAIAFGEIESVKSISCAIVFMRVSVKCLRTGSVFRLPLMLSASALAPVAVLESPTVFRKRVFTPRAVLLWPVVRLKKAPCPSAVLPFP